jgi:glycerol-3-phosphate dehydrogenase (NAD(P)+)
MTKKPASKPTSALIIGAGEIGRAVGHLLAKTDVKVELWDRDPSHLTCRRPLAELVPEANFVFLCVPSWAVRPVATQIKVNGLDRHAVVICLAKGLERPTNLDMNAVLSAALPHGQPRVLLAGPMLAEEIEQDLGAVAVAASASSRARETVRDLFSGTSLRVETNPDPNSVAVASVLKNVYAVALGVADGLGWGGNRKGWLAAQAAAEMRQILRTLKANPDILFATGGFADLVATGFSRYSKNHQVGDDLVHCGGISVRSEGANALPGLNRLLRGKTGRYPLLAALTAVVMRRRPASAVFERYFHESP